jgi:diaminohydroxyphosphoribosylaminopyrimidine deaminase / 5-amino-6-(5-phosphoribosylamino)uracil reductase
LHKNSHSPDDVRYMARALQLAKRGLYTTDPNPRVGCVIVRDGRVVGEGWHVRAGEPHAEVHALAAAGQQARGATAYVTLEPCCHHGRTPPCSEALARAGIARVVAAMPDPNPRVASQGIADLERAGVRVDIGLLQAESERLNPGFIARMTRGRPYLRVKLAASLDGRTALANGESKWITGEAARADVQRLRARSSAILTGIGTVLADDPSLTVRDLDIVRQPLRVVVDPHLRMRPAARMLALPGTTLVVTGEDHVSDADADALRSVGAEVLCLPVASGRVDLSQLLEQLAAREVNEILVEAGATLCGELLSAGLVDELVLYLAPHLLGSSARGLFNIPGLGGMAERIALDIRDVRAIGGDWRITARVAR